MENKNKNFLWVGILGLLVLAGLGAWIYQVSNGLIVTGMRNVVSWGLYITAFMYFVGLSAGGLIVSSSATVFNIPSFKKVSLPAVLLSVACIVMAAGFIVVDIGKPQRLLNLIIHPQFRSPLMWDVIVITCYLIISVLYLYFMTQSNPDQRKITIMSRIALPVAILVHSVTAWIFGLMISRVAWHSALMAPIFVASALDSGLALLLIVLWALNRSGKFKMDDKLFSSLAGLLAVFVAVDAFFIGCEILTLVFPGEATVMKDLSLLFSGSLAPFFWGEMILGLLIPFLLLLFAKNREKKSIVLLASALIVIGVFFKRVWLLFSGFIYPMVPGALGVTLGQYNQGVDSTFVPNIWAAQGYYAPTFVEILIFLGIISAGTLVFRFGFQWITKGESGKTKIIGGNTIQQLGGK
ncbi:polysulfide reductase [Desulfosporosinus orientis DSM 765]|uniref:Polysulfide reductase n=1 Tax=Desulfosporosinus orientis (strain ATCC 19365 / DSM 765 / NCIMB 8382 / VKM B-1628 / Singapore I) TaxID=768706 RepID=G7W6I8_DESOD|nr:NrfD/PsrC family molybdoenzyme membrane anchor subunit [Desulfosporosinus orientis]AET68626.1 polysulfide reductase [Desulfosporosinus orientis DSM 765]